MFSEINVRKNRQCDKSKSILVSATHVLIIIWGVLRKFTAFFVIKHDYNTVKTEHLP